MQFLADVFMPCEQCGRQAVQAAGAGGDMARAAGGRGAGSDRTRGAAVLRLVGESGPQAEGARRDRVGVTCASARPPRPCPAGRRSASRSPRTWRPGTASGLSTSSTSRPPACTSTTSRSCWPPSRGWSRRGTRCWSSSTTSRCSRRPTGSSTSGPRAGPQGERWLRRVRPRRWAAHPASHTGRYLREVLAGATAAAGRGEPWARAPASRGRSTWGPPWRWRARCSARWWCTASASS